MSQVPQSQPAYFQHPSKNRSTALLLEILPGLFGIYGIGWIYSNKVGPGVTLLVGGFVWDIIAIIIDIATGGFGCFCSLPVNIAAIVISSVMINNYTKQHPEIFG
ncbi:MAG: hypothetical protein WA821_06365 [Anaerolineales bacterium]